MGIFPESAASHSALHTVWLSLFCPQARGHHRLVEGDPSGWAYGRREGEAIPSPGDGNPSFPGTPRLHNEQSMWESWGSEAVGSGSDMAEWGRLLHAMTGEAQQDL